jgi:hypothetical protein
MEQKIIKLYAWGLVRGSELKEKSRKIEKYRIQVLRHE